MKFESFLSSIILETGQKVDYSVIHWFSEDVKRKNNISRPFKISVIDDTIYFFDADNSPLFKVDSYNLDKFTSFSSSLRTSVSLDYYSPSYLISNDQFFIGKHGLYEDFSIDFSFSDFRYITFNEDNTVDFESYVDLIQSKMTKVYYKKNGEVNSKFIYNLCKKENSALSLSDMLNSIDRFLDDNFSIFSSNIKNKLYDECVDSIFYDKKLVEKRLNILIFIFQTFLLFSQKKIVNSPYIDKFHTDGIKNRNIEFCDFVCNSINSSISLLLLTDFSNGRILKNDVISHSSLIIKNWF